MTTDPNAPDAALLSCPFCGGDAKHTEHSRNENYGYVSLHQVCCQRCNASVSADDHKDAQGWAKASGKFDVIAAWNRRAGQAHERRADAGLLAAATAVLADWDRRMHPYRERYIPPKHPTDVLGDFWSPDAAMVSSEQIAGLRAAITAAKGTDHAPTLDA